MSDKRTFWNRDRGCADLLIFGPIILLICMLFGSCASTAHSACIIPDFPLDFRFDFNTETGGHMDQGGVEWTMHSHDQDDDDFFSDPSVTIFDESVFQGEWRLEVRDTFNVDDGVFHSTLISGQPFDWHALLSLPGNRHTQEILARISRIDDYNCANGAHWIRLPEPSSLLLALMAGLALVATRRKFTKHHPAS